MTNREIFKYEIADYYISKLKEYGRGVLLSDLERWSETELKGKMPEDDERLFSFYKNSTKDILVELELVKIEDKVIDLTLLGRQIAEKNSVREIVQKRIEEKLFVEKKPYRDYKLSILNLCFILLGIIIPFFFNLGTIGISIGWLFVGFGLGFLVSEYIYIYTKIWKN